MRSITVIFLFVSNTILAQNKIAQFASWKPKEGQAQNFETGYKQHLHWHRSNGDRWNWYGWNIISGPRTGVFLDATFEHNWTDFDNAVNTAEDRADNRLHVIPFAELQSLFKVEYISSLSISDSQSLKTKLIRLVTIDVKDIEAGKKLIDKLINVYRLNNEIKNILTFKIIDGGDIHQFILALGFNSFEEFGKSENLQEQLSLIEKQLNVNVIRSITSETLSYRADMSLLQNK